jgi:hypothetical protein
MLAVDVLTIPIGDIHNFSCVVGVFASFIDFKFYAHIKEALTAENRVGLVVIGADIVGRQLIVTALAVSVIVVVIVAGVIVVNQCTAG